MAATHWPRTNARPEPLQWVTANHWCDCSERDRRRRRSPSEDSEDSGELDNYFATGAGGSRGFRGGGTKQPPMGPTKTWNGYQWVTQTSAISNGAVSGEDRKARRLHFGNLPPNVNAKVPGADQLVIEAVWAELKRLGLPHSGGDPSVNPILSVWLSEDQGFAFVEFITPEDASTAMALDGMDMMGQRCRVSRPNDYKEPAVNMAALLANPALLLAQAQAAGGLQAGQLAMPEPVPEPMEVLVLSNLVSRSMCSTSRLHVHAHTHMVLARNDSAGGKHYFSCARGQCAGTECGGCQQARHA
jgi:hypothetical protein